MSIESDCSPSTSPCTSPQFSRFSRSYSSVSMTLFGSGSALSTSPSIATNSSNPSPTTSPRRFLPLKKIQKSKKSRSCSPLQMVDTSTGFQGSSQAPEIDTPNSEPVTPIMPTFNIPALSNHRRTDSTATTNSAKSVRSVRSCHISSPLASPTSDGLQSVNIPGILSWLNGTTIEFWIDQEGIHAVRSTFRLMGYTSEAVEDRDVDLINALTYGLADFMPTYRQVYKFNSSKVDAPPILRRLTKSGDGDKDYISQQASLTVSSNGVYSVSGVEFFDFQPHRAPLVLRWRFEYFVHDSLTEIPGATVQDTKTLTPLRFSCSPGLLHPTHGKKRTTLLQVFKRSPLLRAQAFSGMPHHIIPVAKMNTRAPSGHFFARGL
ncbi:hypothetical protein WOLCODRAFT_141939 [Wolfiporia cocos MD-104 SS10]|uniref:Uncharacterized protein n=1 Tax=Wolfiporia cocos (strain MD-104) TaxID=742152 RepID=A0A2H3IVM4_WOLCO|nr:hypothetical protein WOLCODRAFT_141939 [Wolfiporia cocos MD-104 SS10]